MSALDTHIEQLFGWLKGIGIQPPSKDVLIVEVNDVNQSDGTVQVRQTDLRRPSDYGIRFDELLQAGYPWLTCPAMAFTMGGSLLLSRFLARGRCIRDVLLP